MIFQATFNVRREIQARINPYDAASPQTTSHDAIRELLTTTQHYVAWLLTKQQWTSFETYIRNHGLEQFKFFDMGGFVTNANYKDQGPKLRLYIMQGKGKQ